MAEVPFRALADGVELAVRLTPKGGRDGPDGVVADGAGRALAALRVAAPAVDGAANRALIRLVADGLDVAPSAVRIVRGEGARVKQLRIAGEPARLLARLAAWLGV